MPANNNDLLLNGIVASSDHHAIVNVSSSQNAHGETSTLQLLDSQKLLKMACTPNGTQTAYWVKGKGDIAFGNDMMSSSDSSQLYLIATRNNVIQWKELIEQNGIVSDQTSMVWLPNGNLVLGITFRDSVSIQNNTYISKGEDDILLLVFDTTGTITRSEVYGTMQSENILEMRQNNGLVYFGGNFGGDITMRKIGDKNLVFFGDCPTVPYMTHVDLGANISSRLPAQDIKERNLAQMPNQNIRVFPNPAKAGFTIAEDLSGLPLLLGWPGF